MSLLKKVVLLLFVASFFSGCYTTQIVAPRGSDVTLLDRRAPASVKLQKKNWYVLWGLANLNSNKTAGIIKRNDLKEVRTKTQFTFGDGVLTFLLNIIPTSIGVRTVTIEGNR